MKTREDNYLDIISGLTSASHLLKSTCKSLFQGTSLIYQNLTLMIEDDMNSLQKAMAISFDFDKSLNQKYKKYLPVSLCTKISELNFDFTNSLKIDEIKLT